MSKRVLWLVEVMDWSGHWWSLVSTARFTREAARGMMRREKKTAGEFRYRLTKYVAEKGR